MPDLGLGKALGKAVREGASKAKVVRPGEAEALAADEAAKALKSGESIAPKVEPAPSEAAAPDAVVPKGPDIQPVTPTVKKVAAPVQKPLAPEPVDVSVPKGEEPPPISAEAPPPEAPPPAEVPAAPSAAPAARPVWLTGQQLSDEAKAMMKADLGDFDLEAGHLPNIDTLNTTDDVKRVLLYMAERNRARTEELQGPKATWSETARKADALDPEKEVLPAILGWKPGMPIPDRAMVRAAMQLRAANAAVIKDLGDKIATGSATARDEVAFARHYQIHMEFNSNLEAIGTEKGRELNAMRAPVEGYDEMSMARLNQTIANSGGDIKRLAKAVHMIDSVEGINEVVKTGIWKRAGGAVAGLIPRIFVNGILSGVKTAYKNIFGNTLFPMMNLGETAIAARVGQAREALGISWGAEDKVEVGEALANLHGMISATGDAYRLMARTMRTGTTINDVLQFDGKNTGFKLGDINLAELTDKPFLNRVLGGIDNVLGTTDAVLDAPTKRWLAGQDEFFNTLSYRGYLEQQAFLHVKRQADAGVIKTVEEAAAAAKSFMENAPLDMQEASAEWGAKMTFQNPLGTTGQAWQAAMRATPGAVLVQPFMRTPANIFENAAIRTPLAVFAASFRADIAAGGRRADLAMTRFALGSATTAWVANQVAAGLLTGAAPQDPASAMLWQANGRMPYSKLVTDPFTGDRHWESYAASEPVASVIGAVADAVTIRAYLSEDVDTLTDEDQQAYNAAAAIVAGVMTNAGNKVFMSGIANFVNTAESPKTKIKGYLGGVVPSLVIPYSSALRDMRNVQDPYLREAWTINDKLRDVIPGLSSTLPYRRGLFGENREKNASSIIGVMSAFPESPEKYDTVYKELNRVMEASHTVPLSMPEKHIDGLLLTPKENDRVIELSRTEPIFDDGTVTLHDKMLDTIQSEEYQSLADAPLGQAHILKQLQNKADGAARKMLLSSDRPEDQDFIIRHAAWAAKRARLMGKPQE